MAQGAGLPAGAAHPLDAPLGVDLVEAEGGRERLRQVGPDMLAELAHRRPVGQPGGVAEQMVQRDQRMRFAAAIG